MASGLPTDPTLVSNLIDLFYNKHGKIQHCQLIVCIVKKFLEFLILFIRVYQYNEKTQAKQQRNVFGSFKATGLSANASQWSSNYVSVGKS